MKKKSRNLSVFLLLVFFVSVACFGDSRRDKNASNSESVVSTEDWHTVGTGLDFTLRIPSYLKSVDKLHKDAVLQYSSIIKEFYLIVIPDSIESVHEEFELNKVTEEYPKSLVGYSAFVQNKFKEAVDKLDFITPVSPLTTGKQPIYFYEANGDVDKTSIYYFYALTETKTQYLQLLLWTSLKNKNKLRPTMMNIAESFEVESESNKTATSTENVAPLNGKQIADSVIPVNAKAIYDTETPPEKLLKQALEKVKKSKKNLLIQMGANWCGWCHKLHQLCERNDAIKDILKNNFETLLLNTDDKDGIKFFIDRYHIEMNGIPYLVVLKNDGTFLTQQSTDPFEKDKIHDPNLVLNFLNKWKTA